MHYIQVFTWRLNRRGNTNTWKTILSCSDYQHSHCSFYFLQFAYVQTWHEVVRFGQRNWKRLIRSKVGYALICQSISGSPTNYRPPQSISGWRFGCHLLKHTITLRILSIFITNICKKGLISLNISQFNVSYSHLIDPTKWRLHLWKHHNNLT